MPNYTLHVEYGRDKIIVRVDEQRYADFSIAKLRLMTLGKRERVIRQHLEACLNEPYIPNGLTLAVTMLAE